MTIIEATPSVGVGDVGELYGALARPARADRAARRPRTRGRDRGRVPGRVVPAPRSQPPGSSRDRDGLAGEDRGARGVQAAAPRPARAVARGRGRGSGERPSAHSRSRRRRPSSYSSTASGSGRCAGCPSASSACVWLHAFGLTTSRWPRTRDARGERSNASSLRARAALRDPAVATARRSLDASTARSAAGGGRRSTAPGRACAGASRPGSACAASREAWSLRACPRRRSEPACGGPSGRAGARRARCTARFRRARRAPRSAMTTAELPVNALPLPAVPVVSIGRGWWSARSRGRRLRERRGERSSAR